MKIHLTDIRTYLECKRKFFYTCVERITPKDGNTMEYFEFGTAGHEILASHFKKETPDFEAIENQDHRGLIKFLYETYEENYRETDSNIKIISVEQPISVELDGVEILLTVDLSYMQEKVIKIMDHKFYAKMPFVLLDWDFQASGYLWGVNRFGIKAVEFVLDIIKKDFPEMPTPLKTTGKLSTSPSTLDSTEYILYKKAIEGFKLNPEDYKKELEYLKRRGSSLLKRQSSRRTKEQLNKFEENLRRVVADIKRDAEWFYPSPSKDCERCQFKTLCRTHDSGGDYVYTRDSLYRPKTEVER